MNESISKYNASQSSEDEAICDLLMKELESNLPQSESKIWHKHPVWFIDGNPIVGYSKIKAGIRLLFWSGASFSEPKLQLGSGKFKDASITYTDASQIDVKDLKRCLKKAQKIQWDYKNIVKRKGELLPLKGVEFIKLQ